MRLLLGLFDVIRLTFFNTTKNAFKISHHRSFITSLILAHEELASTRKQDVRY